MEYPFKPKMYYPNIEIHIYFKREDFREGGKDIPHDEFVIQAGTVYIGRDHTQEYVSYYLCAETPYELAERLKLELLTKIIESL
jgi:hypothetical protein